MNILITNDDGYKSDYMLKLAEKLRKMGNNVIIIAPLENQSGKSHGMSYRNDIFVEFKDKDFFVVDGTPVDCVYLARNILINKKIDLVISGINIGSNYAQDIIYSATVAAAREAYIKGGKAIAVSKLKGSNLSTVKMIDIVSSVILKLVSYPMDNYFFNVNIPDFKDLSEKFIFTSLSSIGWDEKVLLVKKDDNGAYYKVGGQKNNSEPELGSDAEALSKGLISVTPLDDIYICIDFLKENRSEK